MSERADELLVEAKQLVKAACDGPWSFKGLHLRSPIGYSVIQICGYEAADDLRFIARARTLVPELIAEVERLRRTERFLRYHEIADEPIRSMSERLVESIEDTDPRLAIAEDVAMNVDQLLKQRDEARTELERIRPVYEAAKAVVAHWRDTSHEDDDSCTIRLENAVDSASSKEAK